MGTSRANNKSAGNSDTKLKLSKRPDVCLVLGGGGMKGGALAGALAVLEENKIPINMIVGCSAGALVGALYSYYRKASIVADKVKSLNFIDLFDVSWLNYIKLLFTKQGLCRGTNIERLLYHQLPDCDIKGMEIPLVIMGTDLNNFNKVEITSGSLIRAVQASCALPPYFSPVEFEDKTLIDGAISSAIPVDVAKTYKPKIIISVDITTHISDFNHKNMMQVAYRSLDIVHYHYSKLEDTLADIVINPKIEALGTVNTDLEGLYHSGRTAAEEIMPDLLRLLKTKKIALVN